MQIQRICFSEFLLKHGRAELLEGHLFHGNGIIRFSGFMECMVLVNPLVSVTAAGREDQGAEKNEEIFVKDTMQKQTFSPLYAWNCCSICGTFLFDNMLKS
jgi:hypothetical protein